MFAQDVGFPFNFGLPLNPLVGKGDVLRWLRVIKQGEGGLIKGTRILSKMLRKVYSFSQQDGCGLAVTGTLFNYTDYPKPVGLREVAT